MAEREGRRTAQAQGVGTAIQQEQWLRLHAQYHQEVRRLIAQEVECPHDVDDLVQEVFANLLVHNYQMDNPRAYLCTMARHHVCTYWSRRNRILRTEREAASGDGPAGGRPYRDWEPDPLDDLLCRETQAAVQMILACLTPVLAEALRLRFVDGLRLGEAAARAGCARDTLHKRLQRAVRFFACQWERLYRR